MPGVLLAGVWETGKFAFGNAAFVRAILTQFRSLTLALPYLFEAIGENTLHVFGAVNIISIPIGKITQPAFPWRVI